MGDKYNILDKRKKLKLRSISVQYDIEIEKIEEAVASNVQMNFFNCVKESTGEMAGEDGNINDKGF